MPIVFSQATNVNVRTECHAHRYLIFDLHRTILYCRLKETLEPSGWQQKRELAVKALSETARRAQTQPKHHRKDKQSSPAPVFLRDKVHGEGILKHKAI